MFRVLGGILLLFFLQIPPGSALAEGYLAQKPEKLADLVMGLGEAGYGISQAGVRPDHRQSLSPQGQVNRPEALRMGGTGVHEFRLAAQDRG